MATEHEKEQVNRLTKNSSNRLFFQVVIAVCVAVISVNMFKAVQVYDETSDNVHARVETINKKATQKKEQMASPKRQPEPINVLALPLKRVKSQYLKKERLAAIKKHLQTKSINPRFTQQFYNCLSASAYRKNGDILVSTALDWCTKEFTDSGGKFRTAYYNLDYIYGQFSGWDGAHYKLERYVKNIMHDEDSYKHIKTRYHLVTSGQNAPYLNIAIRFKGKNGFGAIRNNRIIARVDIESGDIIEIVSTE